MLKKTRVGYSACPLSIFAYNGAIGMKKSELILPNKTIISGSGFGSPGIFNGELVFTTAMTGYVETMSDPSYQGQILVFSYPLIGNYGVRKEWMESHRICVKGIVVNTLSRSQSYDKTYVSLEEWMEKEGVGGLVTPNTRLLVKLITEGKTKRVTTLKIPGRKAIKNMLCKSNSNVIASQPFAKGWSGNPIGKFEIGNNTQPEPVVYNKKGKTTIVLLDCGIKSSIITEFMKRDCSIVVVPKDTLYETIQSFKPDGIVVSNGPYDPKDAMYRVVTKTTRQCIKYGIPLYGICLGHQILARAIGADTYKLPFGHRGINHSVLDHTTGRAYITSQNHGYGVIEQSIPKDYIVRFTNLLDGSVEGLQHKTKPIFSTQFHPEGHPGPGDTVFLFEEIIQKVQSFKYKVQFNSQVTYSKYD